jgi:ribonuclease P protein subunit POP4
MPTKPENVLRHELIGLKAIVARSSNLSLAGTRGRIIDETKNTIKLSTRKGVKVIPKEVAVFRFDLSDGCSVEVEGAKLVGRPENRMKARGRRW